MKKILIVEDHIDIRKLLKMTLEFDDFEIHEAATGDAGWVLAQGLQPDMSVLPLLDAQPFNPPRVRDVHRASGTTEDTVRQLFRRLARGGELYPVAHDHFVTAAAVAELAAIVARLSAEHGAARAADLRNIIYADGSGGRKVAIQILEFFDRIGYTRRVRDEHVVRGSGAGQAWMDNN